MPQKIYNGCLAIFKNIYKHYQYKTKFINMFENPLTNLDSNYK